MKKKYLKTPEEILALKDTDTKIYIEGSEKYYQFIQGILCYFDDDGSITMFSELGIGKGYSNAYILIEEEEATEEDIGKLCWFWDKECDKRMGILDHIEDGLYYVRNWFYGHCRRLTPAEVAEISGYKVEE